MAASIRRASGSDFSHLCPDRISVLSYGRDSNAGKGARIFRDRCGPRFPLLRSNYRRYDLGSVPIISEAMSDEKRHDAKGTVIQTVSSDD
jgi:hypothetical protein